MSVLDTQLIEAFLGAADSWVCEGSAMDTRFIARKSTGGWEIVDASLTLRPLPLSRHTGFVIATDELFAGQHQAFPVTKQEAVAALRAAALGRLDVNGQVLALAGTDDLDVYSEMTYGDRLYSPLHLKVSARRAAAPAPAAVATLDRSLRRGSPPFDGVADLSNSLGLGADFSFARAPAITLAVAPPVDLVVDQTSLTANTFVATLHAHPSLDVSEVSLAVRATPGDGLAGRRQVADAIVWAAPQDHRRSGKLEVSLPSSDSVLTMLSLGPETIRRLWTLDPQKARNARYMSVNLFDTDLTMLRHALFHDTKAHKFEQAVATLLHILGFSAALPLETDSPDIVVATPAGRTVVVECTTRMADFTSKSGKLVERRAALSRLLSEASLPSSVTAALVCRLRREEIAVNKEELRERQVLLFSAEDIESALFRSRVVPDPDALLEQSISARGLAG